MLTETSMKNYATTINHSRTISDFLKSPTNACLSSPLPETHHSHLSLTHDEVDSDIYRFEEARLQSYWNWPLAYIKPEKLAAAGFYYLGKDDKVKCFECGLKISDWVEGDLPMVDHQRWSGNCRFLRKKDCGNVPIGVDPNTVLPPKPKSRDVRGPYDLEYQTMSASDNHNFWTELELASTDKLDSLGLRKHRGPQHPKYSTYDSRLHTFETWPKSLPQTKEQLANAGFYYTGKSDRTICYHCGGGLKDWEKNDDPWEQHAQFFPKCHYLLVKKGQDYINKVIGKHITPPSIEEMSKTHCNALNNITSKYQHTSCKITV